MAATFSAGYTFGASEQVTNAKLHALVTGATVTGIINSEIASDAAIATSKLADIDGSKLTGLANIASGAGKIPAANLPIVDSYALKGANSDITSLSGLTTPISVAQGGTGAATTANARTNLGLVIGTNVLAPNGDGSQLTGISAGDMSYANTRMKCGTMTFTFSSESTKAVTVSGIGFTSTIIRFEYKSANGTSQSYLGTASCVFDGTTHYSVHNSMKASSSTTQGIGNAGYFVLPYSHENTNAMNYFRAVVSNVTNNAFTVTLTAYDGYNNPWNFDGTVYLLYTAYR